jgi:hypothetical protein
MRWQEVIPITRDDAQVALDSDSPSIVCDALVRITYHDPDWRWVQEQLLKFSKHSNADIRGLAATCFGHLARIHRVLDLKLVLPVLSELLRDSEVSGRAQDALDDIRIYLEHKRKTG